MQEQKVCEANWDLLNDLADGRLSDRRRRKAESHLQSCLRCRDTLAAITSLKQAIVEEPAPDVSTGFWERCHERIAASLPSSAKPARRIWKPAFGLALASAAAAIVLLCVCPGRFSQEDEISHNDYVMEHAAFAAAQPLDMSSHHILLSAQGAENREQAGTSDDLESTDHDAQDGSR